MARGLNADADLTDAEVLGESLKLADAVAGAGGAIGRVVGEEKLDDGAAGFAGGGGVGLDDHVGTHREGAARLEHALLLDLDKADSAGAHGGQVGMVAEGGDLDAGLLGRLKDGHAGGRRDLLAVDGDCEL